jgi:uncharacterized membrane protein
VRNADILPPVQGRPTREELDRLAQFHTLDEAGVEAMLALASARPGRAEGRQFLAQCLRIGGVLSLAAGLIFFVAANWSDIAVFGRFALVEFLLLACGALALWKPPPASLGRGALFLAFVATGALLALFGQTYQTGADVYELFLSWTLLGLLIALVAQWSLTTAVWMLVLNVSLLLYCGWQPAGGVLWELLGSNRMQPADLVIGAAWLNLLLWLAAEWWRPAAVPGWVRRLLVSCAFLFATWAGLLAVLGSGMLSSVDRPAPGFSIAPLALLAAMALTVLLTLRRREDIYPLAVVMGCFIVVSTAWLADAISSPDAGAFLLFALYLIVVSTLGGRLLLGLLRRWRDEASA